MKLRTLIPLAALALVAFAGSLLAQTTPPAPAELPKTLSEFWILAIAAVTPLVVGGVYKIVPKIPKLVLPCLTPVIGIVLGLLINWLAKHNLGWVDMAQAGALAVFVREVFNQAVTKQLTPPTTV